jgi:site-specific recombinase XerD
LPVLEQYLRSFERFLRGKNLAENTVTLYLKRAREFDRWLDALPEQAPQGELARPATANDVTGDHVSGYVQATIERTSAGTGSNHYRALQQAFKFLFDEEEIDRTPFARLQPPKVVLKPVPVLREDGLKKLLAGCRGKDFTSRRDAAIIMTFLDTGMRLASCAGLNFAEKDIESDVDFTQDVFRIRLKGGLHHAVPFGNKTGLALDRYLRVRAQLRAEAKLAIDGPLWLGSLRKDRLTGSGIAQMLERRCKEAGLPHINPHQFRHTFAHVWRVDGGDETDLMRLMGWTSRQMLSRYGASAADERAIKAHRKNSPGDRL